MTGRATSTDPLHVDWHRLAHLRATIPVVNPEAPDESDFIYTLTPATINTVPAFVATVFGGVPSLRVLVVRECDAMKKVGVRHGRLQMFSVSHCKGLHKLRLETKQLKSLAIEKCHELEDLELKEIRVKDLYLGELHLFVMMP